MKSIFKYDSCLDFLTDWLHSRPGRGHGFRNEIALATETHATFVSQVLKGKAHFSLEQGLRLAKYLGLTDSERRYFQLLLQKDRAGTRELFQFVQEQLEEIRTQQLNRKAQTKLEDAPERLNQQIYFSSWIYAAVHLLCQIKGFHSPEEIAERLGVERQEVAQILQFLETSELIEANGNGYVSGKKQFYLEKGSPFLISHQLNWRLKSCQDVQTRKPGTHFTAAVSLSREDVTRIQEILDKSITDSIDVAKASKEEDLYCILVDFFRA